IATEKLVNIEQDTKQCQGEFAEISGKYAQMQQQLRNTRADIQEIEARHDSNIHDVNLLRLRDELRQHLSFDEHELMFIGELIDVKDQEKAWQGAIERALG